MPACLSLSVLIASCVPFFCGLYYLPYYSSLRMSVKNDLLSRNSEGCLTSLRRLVGGGEEEERSIEESPRLLALTNRRVYIGVNGKLPDFPFCLSLYWSTKTVTSSITRYSPGAVVTMACETPDLFTQTHYLGSPITRRSQS